MLWAGPLQMPGRRGDKGTGVSPPLFHSRSVKRPAGPQARSTYPSIKDIEGRDALPPRMVEGHSPLANPFCPRENVKTSFGFRENQTCLDSNGTQDFLGFLRKLWVGGRSRLLESESQ